MTSELSKNFINNFPFPTMREQQASVLTDIGNAFESGVKVVVLQAPVGFEKSPVAVAAALGLGSSYIIIYTKDLQTQYKSNFPFLRLMKGIIMLVMLKKIFKQPALSNV